MTPEIRPGELLGAAAPSRLVADWLRGGTPLGSAAQELAGVPAVPPGPAPWFAGGGPAEWAATMRDELPEAEAARFDADRALLAGGEARVIVTGQQPGYAGGPLLTVLKIATAVALARRESAAGRPTVPVFWLGDDDDDVREALATRLWDPASGMLLDSGAGGPLAAGGPAPRRLGTFAMLEGQRDVGPWLARHADPADGLGLAALWKSGAAAGATWSSIVRRALLRIFAGEGLMIVSGDDPALHRAAESLYRRVVPRREELAALARREGGELAGRNWHAQIGESSLKRPLFRVAGAGRAALPADADGVPAAELRPGVLLRSPVQDWLLRPAAVVVGPGECAYLKQLEPVYAELAIPRAPLVHRLSACLLPPGCDRSFLRVAAGDMVVRGDGTPAWLDGWLDGTTAGLAALLEGHLGLDPREAGRLAGRRVGRWRRGLEAMVAGELKRRQRRRPPGLPEWVLPGAAPQERTLSWLGALARWGEDLRDALLEAAQAHLTTGGEGDWRQMEITVDEPEDGHERQP